MSFDEMKTSFLGEPPNRATDFPTLLTNLSGLDPIRVKATATNPLEKL
jgi:hypothetical protein